MSLAVQQLVGGISAASFVVFVSCLFWGYFQYVTQFCLAAAACAMGLVPLVASTSLLVLSRQRLLRPFDELAALGATAGACTALFFACWWVAATFVLTFLGPFLLTSNAYFACWGALGLSCWLLLDLSSKAAEVAKDGVGGGRSARALFACALFSAALFTSSLPRLGDSAEAVYLMIGACGSLGVLAALCIPSCAARLNAPWRGALVVALAVLWISLVWFATFAGPFGLTGNGYFAAWLGMLSALRGALAEASHPGADADGAAMRSAAGRHLLALVGAASLVVTLVAAGSRQGYGLYALIAAGGSLGVVLVSLGLRCFDGGLADELGQSVVCTCTRASGRPISCEALTATCLCVWWLVAVFVLTFFGPYTLTSNGYFGLWAALGFSAWLLHRLTQPVQTDIAEHREAHRQPDDDDRPEGARPEGARPEGAPPEGARPESARSGGDATLRVGGWLVEMRAVLSVQLFACVVLLAAGIAARATSAASIFAMVACGCTTALVALLWRGQTSVKLTAALKAVGFALWVFVVWFTTFAGDFTVTGNGYFSAWLGLACAVVLLSADVAAMDLLCCGRGGRASIAAARDPHNERASLTLAMELESAADTQLAEDEAATDEEEPSASGSAPNIDAHVDAHASMVEVEVEDASIPPRPQQSSTWETQPEVV